MTTILIAEDDADISAPVKRLLDAEGYRTIVTDRGDTAFDTVLRERPDLVILDIEMPGKNGLDVCRELRMRGYYSPIIMLTQRTEEADRVSGLELGADDYVTKPFGRRELVARVRARLRQHGGDPSGPSNRLQVGGAVVDLDRGVAIAVNGKETALTATELRILKALAEQRGAAVPRERIIQRLWGPNSAGASRTIDTHINHLRQKLEPDPAHPRYILTVQGVGYRLE